MKTFHKPCASQTDLLRLFLMMAVLFAVVPVAQAQCEPAETYISSPADGATEVAPATFTLAAKQGSGSCSIKSVEFLGNGKSICVDTTSPWGCTWADVMPGTYEVVARSTDSGSNVIDSMPITVTSTNTPPTVSLTSPASGEVATAPATFTLKASASDSDGSITQVEFRLDGALINTDTAAPYEHVHSGLAAGVYTFEARAYDNIGATANSSVSVTSNAPPQVSMTSPADGASAPEPATFTLAATATDADGTISQVEFYSNGILINSDTAAPYEYIHGALAAGTYSFEARAYDSLGATASSSVSVSVTGNLRPVVSLTSPADGASAVAPATFTLAATASDTDGTISQVEFYSNNALVNTDTLAPYEYVHGGLKSGTYAFTAKAYDNQGGTQTSAASTVTVTPPDVSVTRTYVYDAQQRPCKIIEPETGATILAYDAAGNLAWSASGLTLPSTSNCDDRDDVTVAPRRVMRSYDKRGRLESLRFPDGRGNQDWVYTPDGLPDTITTSNDAMGVVVNSYNYNKRRLLETERIELTALHVWSFLHSYDANGHEASLTYPSGLTVDFAPNALGQPTQAGTFAHTVTYHPNGAMAQFTYGNGIVHTLEQNARKLPRRSLDTFGGVSVLDDTYDYDANANVASITDGVSGNRGNRSMGYDGLDRLTSVSSVVFGPASYSYDGVDNIGRAAVNGRDHTYAFDTSNRLISVSETATGNPVSLLAYDVQGNLRDRDGRAYGFDFGNRLRSVAEKATYRYDGHGRRVESYDEASTATDWFGYSQSGKLLQDELERKGTKNSYVYLNGSLVARYEISLATSAGKALYQHTDSVGSPVAVTDASRAVVERTEYEPYGATVNKTGDGVGYTGHVMDAATGLTYMQQRYYDPAIGRFLSVDPVTANEGGFGHFNRYAYAYNNPYRFTDPDGRWPSVWGVEAPGKPEALKDIREGLEKVVPGMTAEERGDVAAKIIEKLEMKHVTPATKMKEEFKAKVKESDGKERNKTLKEVSPETRKFMKEFVKDLDGKGVEKVKKALDEAEKELKENKGVDDKVQPR